MSLDSLVAEIRAKGEADLQATLAAQAAEVRRISDERDRQIREIQEESVRATDAEIARDRAQRIAAAKLKARKMLYEARERRLEEALGETRDLLGKFTDSADYPSVLKRMVDYATDQLGKQIRVSGRREDAARLRGIAAKSFDPAPRSILGGIIAETADGSRRLNLSFDELLRLREDQVRELLA